MSANHTFKSSLGQEPEAVFRSFEEEPFAAASLGQVHRAVTRHGEKVAVKIQYPAIRSAIENDLKLLRSVTLPARVTGYAPASIIDEIQRGFLEETDYSQEARNLDLFRNGLRDFDYLTIPKVLTNLSSDRVLTMSFVEGETMVDFLRRKPPQAIRDLIGTRLVELYYTQLHRLHRVHADHHPGNYLFHLDGRIGLIDFGCVKKLNFDASDLIRSCVNRTWREGEKAAARVLAIICGPQVPYRRARRMLPTLETMAGILYPDGKGANPVVDFGKGQLQQMLTAALKQALRDKVTNPEFAFISRADLGLYSLLYQLNARVNVRETWRRCDR
jgi:predicted unusual protein kinase regulating ubiquinone biosynthesis (AarF/ABC1/UbiB family)